MMTNDEYAKMKVVLEEIEKDGGVNWFPCALCTHRVSVTKDCHADYCTHEHLKHLSAVEIFPLDGSPSFWSRLTLIHDVICSCIKNGFFDEYKPEDSLRWKREERNGI